MRRVAQLLSVLLLIGMATVRLPSTAKAQVIQPDLGTYLLRLDGSQPQQLDTVWWDPRSAAWSPDGSRLAVVRGTMGGTVRLLILDGQAPDLGQPLVSVDLGTAFADELTWSPDGNWIAFNAGGLEVIRPDGSSQTALTKDPALDFTWTPDGQGLTFTNVVGSADTGYQRTLVTLAVPSGATAATSPSLGNVCPTRLAWSPDGAQLAYTVGGGQQDPCVNPEAWGLWLWSLGGGITRLAEGKPTSAPVWVDNTHVVASLTPVSTSGGSVSLIETTTLFSIDGTQQALGTSPLPCYSTAPPQVAGGTILFNEPNPDEQTAAVLSTDLTGAPPRLLSPPGATAVVALLSPDGQRVVWSVIGDGETDLVLGDVNSGTTRTLLRSATLVFAEQWSPDGSSLLVNVDAFSTHEFCTFP